jgi:hypothetical protein
MLNPPPHFGNPQAFLAQTILSVLCSIRSQGKFLRPRRWSWMNRGRELTRSTAAPQFRRKQDLIAHGGSFWLSRITGHVLASDGVASNGRTLPRGWEDENEHRHTRSLSACAYLLGNSLQQSAVDCHPNCRRGDWAAIGGASDIGPSSTRWLVLRPPQGSDSCDSRPLFSNSQPPSTSSEV